MKSRHITSAIVCAVLALGVPMAAFAQDDASQLTVEQLDALFSAQRTRGLVLAPAAEDEVATPEAVDPEPGTAIALADPTYVQNAPETQVNIRVDFAFDSASLADTEKAKLATLCEYMNGAQDRNFNIVGHTDASGTDSYNQRLSLLRAEEVKRYLVNDCGVSADRLVATGVGEAFPFDANDPRADANRRVEFQLGS